MSSNSKGNAKPKRRASGKSSKSDKSSKVDKTATKTKKKKRKKTKAEQAEEMKKAFSQVEQNVEDNKPVSTAVVPISLVTQEEVERMTRDNSFLLNPLLANASLQKDLAFCAKRAVNLEELHDHIYDPLTFKEFDEKTMITLYSIGVQDHHKTINEKLKIAELSDKARMVREVQKFYNEKEKQQEIEAIDNSHTSEIIQALISESMRNALDDELKKKWNGSNSYRPPEDDSYDIIAVDMDAEEE